MQKRKFDKTGSSSKTMAKIYKYSVNPHPNNVKPQGNVYFSKYSYLARNGLGGFKYLEEELLVDILKLLDAIDLCRLCRVSKAFYVYSQLNDIWKELVLDSFAGNFEYQHSWKYTFMKIQRKNCELVEYKPLVIEGFFSDSIFTRWYCSQVDLWGWAQIDNIERRSNLSVDQFMEEYCLPNKPVIITDIVTQWPAFKDKLWSKENLIKQFGDKPFKTDQGVMLKLQDYFTYSERVEEPQPMYLFDNDFGERNPELLKQYEVPKYFKEDLFEGLSSVDRPSYRWLLIGPNRSGSSFHKDPNATSAWNGLISGAKKWLLFPPDVVPPGVYPSDDGWEVLTPEATVEWFLDFYGKIKELKLNPVECVLRPGELLFIPSAWWHTALNLEESIAVTQNVVNRGNFKTVANFLKSKKNRVLYNAFINNMESRYPNYLNEWQSVLDSEKTIKKSIGFWQQLTKQTTDNDNINNPADSNNFSFSFNFDIKEEEQGELSNETSE